MKNILKKTGKGRPHFSLLNRKRGPLQEGSNRLAPKAVSYLEVSYKTVLVLSENNLSETSGKFGVVLAFPIFLYFACISL